MLMNNTNLLEKCFINWREITEGPVIDPAVSAGLMSHRRRKKIRTQKNATLEAIWRPLTANLIKQLSRTHCHTGRLDKVNKLAEQHCYVNIVHYK